MIDGQWDIEPDDVEPYRGKPATVIPVATQHPLSQALPQDFPLVRLLEFLPDPKLKQSVDDAAKAALDVKVDGIEGLVAADHAVAQLRGIVRKVEDAFAYPCDLAYKLHRRLTGLRADFLKSGEGAIKAVDDRIYREKRRIETLAQEEQRQRQLAADAEAREQARLVAEEARSKGASEEIVSMYERHAEVASAPAVPAAPLPQLSHLTTVQNWKARFSNQPTHCETNPEKVSQMNEAQCRAFETLVRAVAAGEAPLALLSMNWQAANDRAKAERESMRIPGLEAYDAGGVRVKGGR